MIDATTSGAASNPSPEASTPLAKEAKLNQVENKVEETVEKVDNLFSLETQVQNYPWACFGAAVGIGFLLSRLNQGSRISNATASLAGVAQSGALLAAGKFFERELADLKGYAIKQALGVAKGVVENQVSPDLAPRVGRIFDRAADRLV